MKGLIFGGSSGIGKAVATRISREGGNILICARNEEKLKSAADDIRETGLGNVLWKKIDLGNKVALCPAVDEILRDFGVPDAVLINGGGPPFGSFSKISFEQWEHSTFEIFLSTIRILQKIIPRMESESSVVFILSDVLRTAGAEKILPCSLRLALCGLMKCLSMEFAEHGIRFNAISPGPVETERARSLLEKAAENKNYSFEQMKQEFTATLPMKRMGRPDEIAELAYYLLSDKSGYVTGANFMCDGGLTPFPL
jgi:3-oxoacyl-[acyl-carrier protein] reductase